MTSSLLSVSTVRLNDILELSRVQFYALDLLQHDVISRLETEQGLAYVEFRGLNRDDIEQRFVSYRQEIKYQTMFTMLATIESIVRIDYKEKRRKKGRFRLLYSLNGEKARLEDILDAWKKHTPSDSDVFRKYKDALRLRNWLAHGRYFTYTVGRHDYSIDYIYNLGVQIQSTMDSI